MTRKSARRDGGFTLIEILVVVTILAALMGMVALIAPLAFKQGKETKSQTWVQATAAAITQLASPTSLGWHPPTSVTRLRNRDNVLVGKDLGEGNEFNRGIESVFVALHLQGVTIKLDLPDAALGNTDGDVFPKNITQQDSMDRLEIVDGWGNPLAYFSSADYKKPEAYLKIQMANPDGSPGEVVEARPWKRGKTGLFINPRTFQVFSAGADGVFNTKDDLGNWERSQSAEESANE